MFARLLLGIILGLGLVAFSPAGTANAGGGGGLGDGPAEGRLDIRQGTALINEGAMLTRSKVNSARYLMGILDIDQGIALVQEGRGDIVSPH